MNSPPLVRARGTPRRPESGFSLVETMITILILGVVMSVLITILMGAMRSKTSSSNEMEATQAATTAMDWIADDLRTAGYQADVTYPATPQTPIAYIDSLQVLICSNQMPYPDTLSVKRGMPQAYAPDGLPRPKPLDGTSWEPSVKYRTGAEIIRYTLDVNNDGVVDANDLNAALGSDAKRTPNPNDYVLIRQVYGDSTNGALGNNGGDPEKLALVRGPGAGVPKMFTVYLKGSAIPWDWANGPIPESKLSDIDRVLVQVTTTSPGADSHQNYAQTTLRTQVQVGRNVPSFLATTYVVDGYVYWDKDKNHTKDAGDPGLEDVLVRMGPYTAITNASGYFVIRAPAGTYVLKHTPNSPFGNFNSPDSFNLAIGPGVTRSFADTSQAGGYVISRVFMDANSNLVQDMGESGVQGLEVTVSGGAPQAYTDVNGKTRQFVKAGAFTVSVKLPDSLTCSTANPYAGTMVAGDSVTVLFPVTPTPPGYIAGTVFDDKNRNGSKDGGEKGIANVNVYIVSNGGATIQGYAATDANGNYNISVPSNNPPGTTPYSATVVPPSGFFPTSPTSVGPLLVGPNQTLNGNNFGVAGFQIISLNASRVLSLASGDLQENDWSGGNPATARKDNDLVLGADAGGTDNISIWFNQYNSTPLFTASPSLPTGYTRNAPQSVLSMTLDTLDTNAPKSRPDLVTGTKAGATGNFFVWFNQNTSGNEGFFPSTFSAGQNYWTLDVGDVSSVLTMDCAGGMGPDIIVGTRSPTAGRGTIEIWQNSDAATPTFSRQETYPSAGLIPTGTLGEVASMALADIDGDGRQDLVVTTKTGNYTGELLVFRNVGNTNGNRFLCAYDRPLDVGAGMSLACTDVDGDGQIDVIVGTQTSTSSGDIVEFQNITSGGTIDFRTFSHAAPGIVSALMVGDYGGSARNDLVVGWRADETGYGGGLLIYYLDTGNIPPNGTDPSAGALANFVPALTKANFNYGVNPVSPSPPYLMDLAAGVKTGANTGALVVFIR